MSRGQAIKCDACGFISFVEARMYPTYDIPPMWLAVIGSEIDSERHYCSGICAIDDIERGESE